jgi:ubiquinone/menaquinone biosynthesis C-methylase UbiE
VRNVCAGPFGRFYDFYIERPRLTQLIGRVLWGIDSSILFSSMTPIRRAPAGATIVDIPCGGGVAFRALQRDRDLRYIAADLAPEMLRRAERRARARSLEQIEFLVADMTDLPIADGAVDLFLSFSGLHMVDDPQRAIEEIARCLKPGGEVVGTTFLADGSRRARALFALGARRGHALPPSRDDVLEWLEKAGFDDVNLGTQRGFAAFAARRPV